MLLVAQVVDLGLKQEQAVSSDGCVSPHVRRWRCRSKRSAPAELSSFPALFVPGAGSGSAKGFGPTTMARVLNAIVAVCPDLGIGRNGDLPWHPIRLE